MSNTTLTDEWGEFTAVPNEFIEGSANLSDQARWLFVLLRFHTNRKTKTAFPSYQLIREETGWNYSTIAKAVKGLEEQGWLERRKQFSRNTHYVLKRPSLLDCQSYTDGSNDQSYHLRSTTQKVVQSYTDGSASPIRMVAYQDRDTKKENIKTDKSAAPVSPDRLEQIESRVVKACGILVKNRKAQKAISEAAEEINQTGCTIEEFDQFIESRRKTLAVNFISQTFQQWLTDNRNESPTLPSAPPRETCDLCHGTPGWRYVNPETQKGGQVRCSHPKPARQEVSNGD